VSSKDLIPPLGRFMPATTIGFITNLQHDYPTNDRAAQKYAKGREAFAYIDYDHTVARSPTRDACGPHGEPRKDGRDWLGAALELALSRLESALSRIRALCESISRASSGSRFWSHVCR
jgi:hypothetical protein